MTDNIRDPDTSQTMATHEVDGAHYRIVKLAFGPSGEAVVISDDDPLPVLIVGGGGTSDGLTNAQLRDAAVPVSGPITDAQLRAAAVPVSHGGLTDAQLRAAGVPVTGPLTDGQLRALAVPVSHGGLTDAELRATAVPVSGPLTDAQLRAAAVPVSGPITDAQLRAAAVPVSHGGLTDAQLRAAGVPVTGPLTDAQLRAVAVPVSHGGLTDAELRATPVPVSGPLTDGQMRAAPVPVSVSTASSDALLGGLTEAAPATDTASSGLSGRLQRIAQRITSLIALLPASLGAKTSAASLSVVPATDAIFKGQSCGISASATFTPTNTPYSAGDIIDVAKEFAFTYADGTAVPAGSLIRIVDVVMKVDATALQASEAAYTLQGYSVTPPSAQADNASWSLASGDLTSYRGSLNAGTPVDLGSALYVKTSNIDTEIKLAGTSLFFELVTVAGFTPTAVGRQILIYAIVL